LGRNKKSAASKLSKEDYDYWERVYDAWMKKVDGHTTITPLGCIVPSDLTLHDAKNKKPYFTLPLGKRHEHENAHVAAYMVGNQCAKPQESKDNNVPSQVSHLCHNGGCVNFQHIRLESANQNVSRNRCQGWTHVLCPCGCNHRFNPCTHNPQCILPIQ